MRGNIPRLYNFEIDEFLSRFRLPYYRGVFSSDNAPNIDDDFILICNLSNSKQVGSHYITICRANKTLFVYDSLALNMGNKELLTYLEPLKRRCLEMCFIKKPIQPPDSDACGLYCIFFVLFYHLIASNCRPHTVGIKKFEHLEHNDYICIDNINILKNFMHRKI